jgi:hypothetical protein
MWISFVFSSLSGKPLAQYRIPFPSEYVGDINFTVGRQVNLQTQV